MKWEASMLERFRSCQWHSIFSVDPGVTTGWSWMLVPIGSGSGEFQVVRKAMDSGQFRGGQIEYRGDDDATVDRLLFLHRRSQVAARKAVGSSGKIFCSFLSEDFIPRMFNSSRSFLAPVRINSKLDYLYHRKEIRVDCYRHYLPARAKGVASSSRMIDSNLFIQGCPHESDSIRHSVLHIRQMKVETK